MHWLPDGFPAVFGDLHLTMVDGLIMRLITARGDLDDPERSARARRLIGTVVQAVQGGNSRSKGFRHEVMVEALAATERDGMDPELRVRVAYLSIRTRLPDAKPSTEVFRRAVELWPSKKHRAARAAALRELAKELGCDAKSLPTRLRQARKRLRDREKARKRARKARTT